MSTPPTLRVAEEGTVADRPDGYREGTGWACRRETLVCAGALLQAPGDTRSTCHLICDDCIARARTPHRRAALRAALAKRPA
ncbi:hypothetical protein ABZW03_18385 [Kitasatospora sp. NPDC004799]|uniref:hypothetical protein n=1 Tax=Kitasatospora sp. NPDC004799 TaxID=3154460 RepID=UPI0033A33720